jgi:HNH endonuclease
MDIALVREVRRRARERCEYCLLPQALIRLTFHIDHVIAQQHEGPTAARNLSLCCPHCNLRKGTNLAGIDPDSRTIVILFNPRQDRWRDHFRLDGPRIVGLTLAGRATVALLDMNTGHRVRLREAALAAYSIKIP